MPAALHRMKLHPIPFEKIKNGSKTIELRLSDEKRQQVRIGDFIEFSCTDSPVPCNLFRGHKAEKEK